MKYILRLFFVFVFALLSACANAPSSGVDSQTPPPASGAPDTSAANGAGVPAIDKDARIINITAENWKFTPNVIRIKKGEKAVIQLQGISGYHGFSVPGLGINQPIGAGETKTVEVPTDRAGTFDFFCSIPCGAGHSGMTGMILIEE